MAPPEDEKCQALQELQLQHRTLQHRLRHHRSVAIPHFLQARESWQTSAQLSDAKSERSLKSLRPEWLMPQPRRKGVQPRMQEKTMSAVVKGAAAEQAARQERILRQLDSETPWTVGTTVDHQPEKTR